MTGSAAASAGTGASAVEIDPAPAMISTENGSGTLSSGWRDGSISNHVSKIECTASESKNNQVSKG